MFVRENESIISLVTSIAWEPLRLFAWCYSSIRVTCIPRSCDLQLINFPLFRANQAKFLVRSVSYVEEQCGSWKLLNWTHLVCRAYFVDMNSDLRKGPDCYLFLSFALLLSWNDQHRLNLTHAVLKKKTLICQGCTGR